MIPPDLLARAREAFTEAGGSHAGLEAALSVLSAAWPVADGRLREAATALDQFAWSSVSTDHPDALAYLRSLVSDLRAALSPPSAPAADVRIVRVAVAAAIEKPEDVSIWLIEPDQDEIDAWDRADGCGYPIRLCIAEIPVPIRDVPTVRASVEAPHD